MEETKALVVPDGAYLAHYGVKGMRWGVRNDKPRDRLPEQHEALSRAQKADYELLKSHSPLAGHTRWETLSGEDAYRAGKFIDRERTDMHMKLNPSSFDTKVKDRLGVDEKIRLERALEQYHNSASAMSNRDNTALRVYGSPTDEVTYNPRTGELESIAVSSLVLNPGMTEKELIEKMQQRRAAIMQAEAAYAKTPAGMVDNVIKKGKALVQRAMNKLSKLFG